MSYFTHMCPMNVTFEKELSNFIVSNFQNISERAKIKALQIHHCILQCKNMYGIKEKDNNMVRRQQIC